MGVSGPLFTPDGRVNAVYLLELFRAVAEETSARLRREYAVDVPLTGGLWGGSWCFADDLGYTRTRFRRLYSLVCVPQIPSLENADNYNLVFWHYSQVLTETFAPYGIALEDARWGERIEYSNRRRPTIALQMWDANKKLDFVRCFFGYNSAEWEEAYLYETLRHVKQAKEALDSRRLAAPPPMDGMALRFQLQDIVILYSTLEPALSDRVKAFAAPLVERIKTRFEQGWCDEDEMRALNAEAFEHGLIYDFEDAVREDFLREGLDITRLEEWPVDRINRVPASLKCKLAPPLRAVFQGFRESLRKKQVSDSVSSHGGFRG
jgi:hypothetical protein